MAMSYTMGETLKSYNPCLPLEIQVKSQLSCVKKKKDYVRGSYDLFSVGY